MVGGMRPTRDQIETAVQANWAKHEDGRWECLNYPHGVYSYGEAQKITEACLILGVTVSATVSTAMIHTLAVRLLALEDAVFSQTSSA